MTNEDRLVELEVKLAFQDQMIGDLDEVVRRLRSEVDALRAELSALTESLQAHRGEIVDEKPPHW